MIKGGLIFFGLLFGGISFGQFGFQRTNFITVEEDGLEEVFAWVGGMDYCQFSNIDLDFDGVEDLFVFDRTCNKVLTFLQKGGPGETDYEYAPQYETDFPLDLHDWVLLADYNCDGKKDIYTYAIGGARVFKNTGSIADGNTFELASPLLKTTIYGGVTYMYLSSPDIASIVDVDGDGDTDVLGFGVLGTAVEYHKNLSMELYGTCDSLVYETKNICWGRFREDVASNDVTLWDTLVYPCREMDLGDELVGRPTENQDRHAGSSLLALDMDNSGVLDLIIGDISYTNLTMLLNEGTEVNTNSGMYFQDNSFPSESVPVDLPIFPAAYHVDLNNDGVRDLLVSPNSKVGSENVQSVWRYMNEGAELEPDFIYSEKDFLQGQMIDAGTSSLPVFFDHDGDGLKDLLVSSQGRYNPISGNQICKIQYYHNNGTATEPKFEFVTDDYQGLSTKGIGASLVFYPTFGDLDGDGDEDMIIGEYTGYCYYMENTGGAGNPAIFNTFSTLANSVGALIFDGTYAYPNLVDLDRDGDLDLVIGRRTGKLQYFKNIGISSYSFELVTGTLGNVNVAGAGFIEGQAIPQFVDVEGEYKLVIGTKRGYVYFYDDIDANIGGTFHLVDSTLDNIDIGTFSAPAIANLNGDNRLEMVLGNRRGGVVLFESAPTNNIGVTAIEAINEILIYPNPTNDMVTIVLGNLTSEELKQIKLQIYTVQGELVKSVQPTENTYKMAVSDLAKGIYLVQIMNNNQLTVKRLVIN
jgi:hypothetical protein